MPQIVASHMIIIYDRSLCIVKAAGVNNTKLVVVAFDAVEK
jgi:hypothetical protein